MPDVDLGPEEYRAPPEKGQPVFKRGGLLRLTLFLVIVIASVAAGSLLNPYSHAFVRWLTGN